MVLITCRVCRKTWDCSIKVREYCTISEKICEICAECMAKNSQSTLEQVLRGNPKCFPVPEKVVPFNPSRR